MSEEKTPTKTKSSSEVQLYGNGLRAGSMVEQSLSRLDQEQAKNLMGKAAEEALRLEVKNREQNLDYVVGKKVAEDHIDTFNNIEKSGRLTRQSVTSDIKTGAGNMRIESKSGATCFVATVAYGNPNHPDVIFLRGFRDSTLQGFAIGRSFINWYWKWGPKIANATKGSVAFRLVARQLIKIIIFGIRLLSFK